MIIICCACIVTNYSQKLDIYQGVHLTNLKFDTLTNWATTNGFISITVTFQLHPITAFSNSPFLSSLVSPWEVGKGFVSLWGGWRKIWTWEKEKIYAVVSLRLRDINVMESWVKAGPLRAWVYSPFQVWIRLDLSLLELSVLPNERLKRIKSKTFYYLMSPSFWQYHHNILKMMKFPLFTIN